MICRNSLSVSAGPVILMYVDDKSPSSHNYANRQFLERRNKEFKYIPISRSTVARSPRPQVTLTIFRAGQVEAVCSPASI